MSHLLQCNVLLRTYTLFMSGLYSYSQLAVPNTLMYRVAHSDPIAYYTAWLLGCLAVLGFIDLIVNDLMPKQFTLLQALRDRHLVLMAIPICYAIQMFSAVKHDHPYIILAYYGVYVFIVPVSAFADIQRRHYQKTCP